jgi:signal peptidase
MEPAISPGDFVIARPVDPADIVRGNVIVFEADQGIAIAHRVVRVVRVVFDLEDSSTGEVTTQSVEYRFTTRGDANPVNDSDFVTDDRVAGEVWFTIPGFGLGATSFPFQSALLGVAIVFGLSWAVWEFRVHRKSEVG